MRHKYAVTAAVSAVGAVLTVALCLPVLAGRDHSLPWPPTLLATVLLLVLAARSTAYVGPDRGSRAAQLSADGAVLTAAAVLLPAPALLVHAAVLGALAWRRPWPRQVVVPSYAAVSSILAAVTFWAVLGTDTQTVAAAGAERVGLACAAAAVVLELSSCTAVTLLARLVDGIPVAELPMWRPAVFTRSLVLGLQGGVVAGLALVSPWLALDAIPVAALCGLLVRDSRARAEAMHDPKTGLLNSRAFTALGRIELARAARHGHETALLVLDLDHLREVNNAHGHPVGDAAILAISDALRSLVRRHDVAARVGGEEFVVLLPETSLPGAVETGERLCRLVRSAAIEGRTGPVTVTVSVGVAAARPGESLDELFARADAVLYRAKERGRDRVEVEPAAAGVPA